MAQDCVQRRALVLAVLELPSTGEFVIYLVKFIVTRSVNSHVIYLSFASPGHDFYHSLRLADFARFPSKNYGNDGHVIF